MINNYKVFCKGWELNYLPDFQNLTVARKYLNALTSFDIARLTYLLFSTKKKNNLSSLHFII